MSTPETRTDLEGMIQAGDLRGLRQAVAGWTPPEIADLVDRLPAREGVVLFRLLPRHLLAEVFEFLDSHRQKRIVQDLATERGLLTELLSDLSADDRTALLEELPGEAAQRLLNLLPPDERRVAITLLGYPEGSVGRLMAPAYVAVRPGWTVQEALAHVRQYGKDSESLDVLYVVDQGWRLLDDLRIRELLLADPDRRVADLMDRRFVALAATDDQETAVRAFRTHGGHVLPVTDTQGTLLGIVTIDDVLEVAHEEATEDIQKIGGSEALDDPYLRTPLRILVRKRARWLVVLFLGEMLTATAMGFFEAEIARAVVLALFVPLIISSGGNSGSQAATLVIRALAVGEIGLADWWRVIRREIPSGLALGGLLGVIGATRVVVWNELFGLYGEHGLLVGLTVGLSLVGVVLWGTLAGSMLPLALKRLGADPAVSSAPFVATLVDVTGLVIYFGVAALILRGTLL